MSQQPEQNVPSAKGENVSPAHGGGASQASTPDLLPGDHPRVEIVDGKERYIPQRWDEGLPLPDYSGVQPEHDGRAFHTPPEGLQPASQPSLPVIKGAGQADYDAAIRQQLLPRETFWRRYTHHAGFRNFIKDKREAERALIDAAFQLDLNGSAPTLDDCIPKNSILEAVDRYFWEYTDMPRELPFFYVMHYVLASLMQRGVEIHKGKQVILPDLWTVVVARSGSGKTLSQKQLDKAMAGAVKTFPDATTSLQFLKNLRDHRLGLFIRDEFAQFLRNVTKEDSMKAVRDYLLRTYDNSTIEHTTTVKSISVEKSAISILGYTPTKTLKTYLTPEMLLDGFAQRFSFCVAEQDDRPIIGDYDFDQLADQVAPHWNKIVNTPPHPVYRVSNEARGVFNYVVGQIVAKAREDDIDDSFSRRLAFNTYKYGLAYHILSGKTDDVIGPEDLAQGAQLVALHLVNLRKILDLYEVADKSGAKPPMHVAVKARGVESTAAVVAPELTAASQPADKLRKVLAYLQKQKAVNASPIPLRKLQSSIKALHGAGGAQDTRELAQQAIKEDPSLAPFVVIS